MMCRLTRRSMLLLAAALLPTCLFSSATVSAQGAKPKPIRVLMLTGFDVKSHPWKKTSPLVRDILEKDSNCQVFICEDLGILESSSLDKYDVIVLNYGFWKEPEPSAKGKQALLDFVKNGKGLVALHFACSAFQDWPEYQALLGRVWKKGIGGHGPMGQFEVKIVDQDHPIAQGVSDFTITDELYARLSGDAPIDVIAQADSEWSGKTEPIVFSHEYGSGRVVQNVLGHPIEARQHPAYQKLLIQSVKWAARR